ncbi:MAG: DUF4340 domain-containing protein, partial [Acidobacteria bacterium]|nr:DUF4340 domain-containing protein [Acidobacteriota bacterium]
EVSFADKPDFHLEVGNTVPDQVGRYYGRVGDHLYEISTELPQLAREDLDSWRSKAWSALPVYLVDGATMTLDGTTVELHRDGSDWRRGDDLVAYDTVSELLYAVHDVQADEILPPARAAGLPKEPKLHLHLTTSTGEEDLSLYPVEGHFVARTEGRDVLLELPAETGDKIVRIATELRDAPAQPEKPPTGNDETSDPELDDGG